MAENSKIEWCDHTFNPWIGCTKISDACDNCYAENFAKRFKMAEWGPHANRLRTSAANWNKPRAWNRAAEKAGKRARVFCASLADIFDNHKSIKPKWRADFWELVRDTPHLDWLLLTKRPQNIKKYLFDGWCIGPHNVWLGTTVENQAEAERRIPALLDVPAQVHFLSCEPLLGAVDMEVAWNGDIALNAKCWGECVWCAKGYTPLHNCQKGKQSNELCDKGYSGIDWIIAGGESGRNARPMHPNWLRSLRDQCAAANVPFFFKQWGEWAPDPELPSELQEHYELLGQWDGTSRRVGKKAAGRKFEGKEYSQFPEDEATNV